MKPGEPIPVNIEDWLSPYGFKMIVDSSPKYKKAFKSYAFGLIKKISGKWIFIVIGAIGVIIAILFFTGRLG